MRLALVLVVLACLAAGCASDAGPEPERVQQVELPLSRAVGRKIVTGMEGTFPSRARRARVRKGQVGGVILFGPNVGPGLGRAIAALQRAARAGGHPPLLIAVDQEGGEVKRLSSLPPRLAPARLSAAVARSEAGP